MAPTPTPRPWLLLGLAVAVGVVVVALIVVVIVLASGDGDGDGAEPTVVTTATQQAVTEPTTPAATAGPTLTPTEVPPGPDETLETFLRDEFNAAYIGECPQEIDPSGQVPDGICSLELYRGQDLVTFQIGAPFSEFIGEVVLLLNADGTWSADFVEFGELGATLSVGGTAVVYGSGSCLNFRAQPNTNAELRSCELDGTTGTVGDGPRPANGRNWWRIDGLGWAVEEFLRPAAQ